MRNTLKFLTKKWWFKVNVQEAAQRLNKSEQFIRIGLQRDRLPFGTAVKTSTRWSYHISKEAFEKYLREGR